MKKLILLLFVLISHITIADTIIVYKPTKDISKEINNIAKEMINRNIFKEKLDSQYRGEETTLFAYLEGYNINTTSAQAQLTYLLSPFEVEDKRYIPKFLSQNRVINIEFEIDQILDF